jgi:hypothetical protein
MMLAIVVTMTLGGACQAELPVLHDAQCKPSFRKIGTGIILAEVGHWTLTHRYFLVGCKNELDALTNEELDLLPKAMKQATIDFGLGFKGIDGHGEEYQRIRNLVTDSLNKALDRKVVWDVIILDFATRDNMPH